MFLRLTSDHSPYCQFCQHTAILGPDMNVRCRITIPLHLSLDAALHPIKKVDGSRWHPVIVAYPNCPTNLPFCHLSVHQNIFNLEHSHSTILLILSRFHFQFRPLSWEDTNARWRTSLFNLSCYTQLTSVLDPDELARAKTFQTKVRQLRNGKVEEEDVHNGGLEVGYCCTRPTSRLSSTFHSGYTNPRHKMGWRRRRPL